MTTKTTSIKSRLFLLLAAIFAAAIAPSLAACTLFETEPERDYYIVTFDSNGGSEVQSQNVDRGGKVIRPYDPVKEGKVFVNWYKDIPLTVAWNFATGTVSSDMTLHAAWRSVDSPVIDDPEPDPTRDYYIVYFDTNGGSEVPSQNVNNGGKVNRPDDPEKEGKSFANWYKDLALTQVWNFSVDVVSEDMTLHAGWSSVGSSEIDDPEPQPEPEPNPNPNPEPQPEPEPNPTPTPDPDPDPIGTDGVTATFNVGRDARLDGASNPAPQTVTSGQGITAPTVTRAGYTLSGWYAEEGSVKWNFATDKLIKNTTFFAKWTSGGGSTSSDDREEYTQTMKTANTLYIHYRRADGNYSGWHVWGWPEGKGGSWYESVATDKSGAVYAIDVSDFGSTALFLVAKNGWEAKDGEENNTLSLASAQKVENSYHWYVDSGAVASGKNYLSKAGSGSSGGGSTQTEALRESRGNVDRSVAQSLPVESTVNGWDEAGVGYQIFVASFCDSNGDGLGDIRGIIKRLDYLDSLNVDVLWLTPIQSSDSSHGYDCYDYYSIDPKFGTNADYRELVYKAHQKGIKIIMDLVVNHTSQKNEWFIKSKNGVVETVTYQDGTTAEVHYRDFYRWKSTGGNRYHSSNGWYFYSSFGSGMPELNYDCQQVRAAMADVASYWMSYGLDGFRMDAIKHVFMWDESDNAGGDVEGGANDKPYNYNLTKNVEFFKEFNHKLKSKYPNCYLLGEQLSGNVADVSPFYKGMDSLFDFNTYYDLPNRISSGDASAQANSLRANDSMYYNNRGDRPINSMITSNHDIPRLADKITDEAKRKLYIAVTLTVPGLTWIYYGDEMGLIGGGTESDQRYRQPMKWTANWEDACNNIPGIRNYSVNGSLASVAEQLAPNATSQLKYVMGLTAVRDRYPALTSGTATYSATDGMLKIESRGANQTVVTYHNFSGSTKTVSESGTCVFGGNSIGAYGTAIFVF